MLVHQRVRWLQMISWKSPDCCPFMPTDTTQTSRPVIWFICSNYLTGCLPGIPRSSKKPDGPRNWRVTEEDPNSQSSLTISLYTSGYLHGPRRVAATKCSLSEFLECHPEEQVQLTSWTNWEMILTEDRQENLPQSFQGQKPGFPTNFQSSSLWFVGSPWWGFDLETNPLAVDDGMFSYWEIPIII